MSNTNLYKKLLAGAAGVTLTLGIAAGAGAVIQSGGDGQVHTAALSSAEQVTAPSARQPGDTTTTAPAPAPTTVATAAPARPAATPTTAAKPRVTAPPTTKAPVKATPAATVAPTPAPTTPPAPVKVARRTPTAAEVQGVISELKRQIGGLLMLVSPTPAQIDQAGDQICTAFDNGQTFSQVKATGLSMIPSSITVPPATADWAVRQAVTLYCPGHAAKLA